MAIRKQSKGTDKRVVKVKVRNKGVHSKTKQSKNKNSKNYVKPYNKQGR